MNTNTSHRVGSIDIFRALTMFLMIFVNDFWTILNVPGWLQHARRAQDMLGLADIVFPSFLFAVGLSIPFAIEKRFTKGESHLKTGFHILLRSFALLFIGFILANATGRHHADSIFSRPTFIMLTLAGIFLVWNLYPRAKDWKKYLFIALQIIGVALLIYLMYIYRDRRGEIMATRGWAVLWIIGWCYLPCALVYFAARKRLIVHILVFLGLIACNIAGSHRWLGFVDGFGAMQIYTMSGIIVSLLFTQYGTTTAGLKKILVIIAGAGVVFLISGFVARNFWIINKLRFTPTWVYFCTGISLLLYALIYWIAEMKGKDKWFNIIKPAGTATLTCYFVPYWVYAVYDAFPHVALPEVIRAQPIGLIKSFVFALLVIWGTWLLGKIKIKLKI